MQAGFLNLEGNIKWSCSQSTNIVHYYSACRQLREYCICKCLIDLKKRDILYHWVWEFSLYIYAPGSKKPCMY